MRCNLAQDVHLQEGVYAYIDVQAALSKIDRTKAEDRRKCIAIVEGYLKYRNDDKLSLNARSTKLIATFSPWDEAIHLPFVLGAEDAMGFRLPPCQIGGPARWFRQLCNIDGKSYNKAAVKARINSGERSTHLSEELLEKIYEVVKYDSQSRNSEDMIEQKRFWIQLFKEPNR